MARTGCGAGGPWERAWQRVGRGAGATAIFTSGGLRLTLLDVALAHFTGDSPADSLAEGSRGRDGPCGPPRTDPDVRHDRLGIRFVLFSGEELGLHGSYACARRHAAEMESVRLGLNADVLALAMPVILQTQASPTLSNYLRTLPLGELDATLHDDHKAFVSNSDHFAFSLGGVPSVWAVPSSAPPGRGRVHFSADTLDTSEPRLLRQTAATVARLLLRMAVEPEALPGGCQSPAAVQELVTEAGFEEALRCIGRWPF